MTPNARARKLPPMGRSPLGTFLGLENSFLSACLARYDPIRDKAELVINPLLDLPDLSLMVRDDDFS